MTHEEDVELVRRTLMGVPQAFAGLIDRYQKVVFNLALRLSGDHDDAEDIAQTVFVKAYEKLGSFDATYGFFSWIYKMTLNESINLINSRKRRSAFGGAMPAPEQLPDERMIQGELQAEISLALAELSIEQRAIIVLRHFADLSYRELGYIFNVPEKMVKSRLFSAREHLRLILQQRGVAINE
jgi:RNA polymerase sigma-70 factor (ECF subfamily)